jgi:hypothetical protein
MWSALLKACCKPLQNVLPGTLCARRHVVAVLVSMSAE